MVVDEIAGRARRRTRIVVVAGLGVAAVLAAVGVGVVALAGHRPTPAGGPPTPAAPNLPAPATTATWSPSSAPPPAPSVALDTDLTWTSVNGARVPVSRTAGPRDTGGGLAHGFAHDARGAVFAAIHITLRLTPQVGPEIFEPTLREQVVGGDAAALRQRTEADYDTARQKLGLAYGGPAGRLYSGVAGYRIDAIGPTTAAVRLLIAGPGLDGGTAYATGALQLRWLGADWVLVAPPRGDWSTVVAFVADPTGYTPLTEGAQPT